MSAVNDLFYCLPPANEWVAGHSLVWPSDGWPTSDLSQVYPDASCTPFVPRGNALGLLGIHGHESVWSAEQVLCPPVTTTSNLTDTQTFDNSSRHQSAIPDIAAHIWQLPTPHHSSARGEPVTEIGATPVHTVRKPTARTLKAPHSRYTPYSLGRDSTKHRDSSAFVHHCLWVDAGRLCGQLVEGNKLAVGQHLRAAHAIRLKADKTHQVCHWDACGKAMRRESIPRHILAVHMHDKVHCPGCGSHFARPDSMQRHRKTCRVSGEDVSNAHSGGLPFP